MAGTSSHTSWITTNIVGGLGNQLFLVANLIATARRNKLQAVLPRYAFSSSQDAPRPTYWSSIFAELPALGVTDSLSPGGQKPCEVVVPERRPVQPLLISDPLPDTLYNLVGFFQSDQFFVDFPFQSRFVPVRLRDLAQRVLRENYLGTSAAHTHVAALHIRRGDYLTYAHIFETLDMSYYDAALRQLFGHQLVVAGTSAAHPALLHALVFCDDEKYGDLAVGYLSAKYAGLQVTLVHPKNERHFVHETNAAQPREVVELLMMAQCHDVVMANSTFSWWGAYLNTNPLHRTIAPSKWFVRHPYPQSNHLYCADWVLL